MALVERFPNLKKLVLTPARLVDQRLPDELTRLRSAIESLDFLKPCLILEELGLAGVTAFTALESLAQLPRL